MTGFVLDNSVAMRWFFDADHYPYADAILSNLVTGTDQAVVPSLWRYEASAVLARAQLKTTIPAQHFFDFIQDLAALPTLVDAESDKRIFSDVHRLAINYSLTTYDAAYLALALRLDLPLATLDAELIAACRGAGVQVL